MIETGPLAHQRRIAPTLHGASISALGTALQLLLLGAVGANLEGGEMGPTYSARHAGWASRVWSRSIGIDPIEAVGSRFDGVWQAG
jgi:hypothetical protein